MRRIPAAMANEQRTSRRHAHTRSHRRTLSRPSCTRSDGRGFVATTDRHPQDMMETVNTQAKITGLPMSPFVVGDTVDCSRWDRTLPPMNRIGTAKVVRVWRAKSQSGIMVKVRGRGTQELDAAWLKHQSTNTRKT